MVKYTQKYLYDTVKIKNAVTIIEIFITHTHYTAKLIGTSANMQRLKKKKKTN